MAQVDLKLAVIGATGLAGRTILEVLEQRDVPVGELIPIASPQSRGKKLVFSGVEYDVSLLQDNRWRKAEIALLSPGSSVSREWIPRLAEAGLICIDNSSAFRQHAAVPLVVPEVNPSAISKGDRIIANPNCSTIQLVVVLAPLHRAFGLQEVVVSTYQSASGIGQKGKEQLLGEISGRVSKPSPFPHKLFQNLIPGIGDLKDAGYFFEEWKLVHETRKILGLPDLRVFSTAVRVPVLHCHAEAVHLRFREDVDPARAREILGSSPGIAIQDSPADGIYPLPLQCVGRDEVFVGRIRQMPGETRTLDLWIVTDNLRKGAATNAVQILELILKSGYLQ